MMTFEYLLFLFLTHLIMSLYNSSFNENIFNNWLAKLLNISLSALISQSKLVQHATEIVALCVHKHLTMYVLKHRLQ